jgi:transcriptional regulator with XRE-family HTH domain
MGIMVNRIVKPFPYPGLGEKIRQARLVKGMKQIDLAMTMGIRKNLMCRWEKEHNVPTQSNLDMLARILDIEMPPATKRRNGRKSDGVKACKVCSANFDAYYGQVYCSAACVSHGKALSMKGKNFKTGRYRNGSGYVQVLVPEHPAAGKGGYVPEHRHLVEQALGRFLESYEQVHHKNAVRWDNRLSNLEVWITGGKHPCGARALDIITDVLTDPALADLDPAVLEQIMSVARGRFDPTWREPGRSSRKRKAN